MHDNQDNMMKAKDAPELEPYFKMLKLGVPMGAVQQKMAREGLDPSLLTVYDH